MSGFVQVGQCPKYGAPTQTQTVFKDGGVLMKERPIIFSSEMVKAILDDKKTQARRVIKPELLQGLLDTLTGRADETDGNFEDLGQRIEPNGIRVWCAEYPEEGAEIIKCPYGQSGDRLWVRETWCNINKPQYKPEIYYKADTLCAEDYDPREWKWKPSIFMPRWASRILLEITDIGIERVQNISEEDAKAEGIIWVMEETAPLSGKYRPCAIKEFQKLWDSLNAKRGYGWDKNPWVWAIKFRKGG